MIIVEFIYFANSTIDALSLRELLHLCLSQQMNLSLSPIYLVIIVSKNSISYDSILGNFFSLLLAEFTKDHEQRIYVIFYFMIERIIFTIYQ